MDAKDVLLDGLDRLPSLVHAAVRGLSADQLRWAPAPGANSIGWLVWHLTRAQDSQLSEALNEEQLYLSGNWAQRFGRKADPSDTGYGHSAADSAQVRPDSAQLLIDYFDAVQGRSVNYVRGLSAADLDRVVDDRWDPPITLGVRLVSVIDDDAQHVGQAAYLRGLL